MSKAASAAKAKAVLGVAVGPAGRPVGQRGDQEADVVGLAVGDVGRGELLGVRAASGKSAPSAGM